MHCALRGNRYYFPITAHPVMFYSVISLQKYEAGSRMRLFFMVNASFYLRHSFKISLVFL